VRSSRADLADAVHRRVGRSRAESAEHVDAVLTEIIEVIVSGENLKLQSLGSFHVRSKNERPGRNPRAASGFLESLGDSRIGVCMQILCRDDDGGGSRREPTAGICVIA
jgi:nucleoid DNA-binding protein